MCDPKKIEGDKRSNGTRVGKEKRGEGINYSIEGKLNENERMWAQRISGSRRGTRQRKTSTDGLTPTKTKGKGIPKGMKKKTKNK